MGGMYMGWGVTLFACQLLPCDSTLVQKTLKNYQLFFFRPIICLTTVESFILGIGEVINTQYCFE